ncbi:MAG: ATP-binding protein, partial [Candidatus Aminicenantes bacterium]|nr:ATP-binding protein [Candidatus Aminicenantes bacterium]
MSTTDDKKLSGKLILINSIRIILLLVLTAATIAVGELTPNPPFPVFPLILAFAAGFCAAILNFIFIKIVKVKVAVYLQLILDILLITALVYLSGGIESPFYFLYILPIIVSSISLSRRDTIYIAALSFIIFGALSELMYLEVAPFFSLFSDEKIQKGTFIYNLVMSMIAFASVALISSHYFERISKTRDELKTVQASLDDLVLLNNTVLEKMENGFITCNSQGVIISSNDKSKSLLKFHDRDNIFDILFKEADYREIEKASAANNQYYFETEIGGSALGISVTMLKNISQFDKLFVFIITNLTGKREIEMMLKKKEHLALIGEMSASMAHEIRNPLASISGSVQFLRKELQLSPEYRNLMDIIVKESNRLSGSIEDFLEFTKVTPMERTRFHLGELIGEIMELAALNNREINIIKKIGEHDLVDADRKKIEQLIWNLVNNSVKALNGRGVIEINVYDRDEQICFSIKDNGTGIDRNDLGNIFNPFYSKFTSGIGLG